MKIQYLAFVPVFTFLAFQAHGQQAKDAKTYTTQKDKFSYAIGFQVGHGLRRNEEILDLDVVLKAISDAYTGKDPAVSVKEMQTAFEAFRAKKQQEQEKLEAEMKAEAAKNKEAGDKFMAENKEKEGVKVTESGLQYKVLEAGSGKKPTETDTVVVNYRGTLINGEEFDSSYKRKQPATLPVNSVIKGWQEALQLMPAGSKWQLVVPPELAYGDRGAGSRIGPGETLVFEVELLEIK